MSTYALQSVFAPASVALVGASPRERSLGRLVLRQLREGGFAGPIGLVNPHYREIDGMPASPRLDALGFAPELVVIAAPPGDVAGVAAAAADCGAKAAIVLTRGMGTGPGSHNAALEAVPEEAEALWHRDLALRRLALPQDVQDAFSAWGAGRADEAARLATKALESDPRQLDAILLLAGLRHEQDAFADALALVERALDIHAQCYEALVHHASLLLTLHRPQEAMASCDRALGSRPNSSEALHLRGKALQDPVSTVMNANPLTSGDGQSRDAAIVLMRDKLIHQLPVVDKDGRVVGLITLDGVLRELRQETLVVLMAGGLGTRLRPLTEATPKPLLPVGGRPLLEITIENLARQGFVNFALSVNYKAKMFRNHFGSGENLGVDIQYLQETERLGTAGALRLLPQRPTTPILMMNGDILTNLDARRLVQYHREHGAAITMCVREYEWKVPYGVVSMTNNYRVASLEEKPSRREFVNAGIYVVSPEALDHLPETGSIDMPNLIDKVGSVSGAAAVYPLHEYWLDIGHLDDLQRAQEDLPGLFR